jgi:predicted molibdopterin-dependent oxidoreductase YjgC
MHLLIDGQQVEVPEGTSVKDAAMKAGIKIPGLCDHPLLSPYGGCRLCLVEIEGVRGYPSSCTMPASEGMVVRTNTPTLRSLRLIILEMLLSEHPAGCLTCERAGKCDDIREGMRKTPQSMGCRYCPADERCELQQVVQLIGLEKIELPHLGGIKDVVRSPFFDRDPNLCILCGRCIRACEDRGLGVISFIFRGFDARIGTAFEKPLEDVGCRFCGACVDVCPTGSLSERGGRWAGLAEQVVSTTCPYCGDNCQIDMEINSGRLIRARSRSSKLCVRGKFALNFVHARDRIQRPMVRKGGRLVEVSWQEALDYAATGLSEHRGEEFALFASGALTSEALYMASKFANNVMIARAVASDLASVDCSLKDLQGSALVVGDLAETNPALELHLRSLEPVVVSPFGTMLATKAGHWLRPDPGGEALTIISLAQAMVGEAAIAGSVFSEEIRRAASDLQGGLVVVGPECSADVRKAASDLAQAAGGRLMLVGRNCNSRAATALGLHLSYEEAMADLTSRRLKAAYMAGSNLVRARPELEEACRELDFLVVQDLFMTETARLADAVFPAASFAEADGTFLGSKGELLQIRSALPLLGRPDWQILAELGRKMGGEGFDFPDCGSVTEEMRAAIGTGQGWEGQVRARQETVVAGRIEAETAHSPLLVEGPSLFQFGSNTRTSKVPDLGYLTRDLEMEINPKDAKKLGVQPGDPMLAELGDRTIDATAKISRRVAEGVLRIPGMESRTSEVRVSKGVSKGCMR